MTLIKNCAGEGYHLFILPEFVSYSGEREGRGGGGGAALCRKRFTFLYTSPYEHMQYNVSGL